MAQKVKRNDPCPCGSGKKYKKCCWEKEVAKKFKAKPLAGSMGGLFQANAVSNAFSSTASAIRQISHKMTQLNHDVGTVPLVPKASDESMKDKILHPAPQGKESTSTGE